MRHKVAGFKLGRTTSHRRSLLRNMVTSLIMEERIETTVPKDKLRSVLVYGGFPLSAQDVVDSITAQLGN